MRVADCTTFVVGETGISGVHIIDPGMVQQRCYLAIIGAEALSGGLLTLGAVALFRQAHRERGFDRALALPVAGLTVAMLLYGGGFLAVGGEWFLMWQSRVWGGSDAAGRLFLLNATVLIVLLAGWGQAGGQEAGSKS